MRYAKRYSNVKGWERTMAQSFVFTAQTRTCEKALNKAVKIHIEKELRKYGLRPSGWGHAALHERTMDLLKAEVNL